MRYLIWKLKLVSNILRLIDITSQFLKAVFHKFYLGHSWILTGALNSAFEEVKIEESNLPEKEKQGKFIIIVAKSLEKRSVAGSQLQAISQHASGLNKLANVNAKRLKMEEKDREALIQLKKKRNWEKSRKQKRNDKNIFSVYNSVGVRKKYARTSFVFSVVNNASY